MYKGKELNEDLKTLKDLGVGPNDQQIHLFISARSQLELDMDMHKGDLTQDPELIAGAIE